MNPLRVFIVAEDLLVRTGWHALLSQQEGIQVVGQGVRERFLADQDIYRPQVMLWDVGWQSPSPLEALDEAHVVALLHGDEQVNDLLPALGVQGRAYALLPRETPPETLTLAFNAVVRGLSVIAPRWLESLTPSPAHAEQAPLQESLTAREIEVLQRVAQGMTNKAIAHALGITEHTVKFHITAIMTKLNAQSRTDAVVKATRYGLVVL